jgi:hypothetical protein
MARASVISPSSISKLSRTTFLGLAGGGGVAFLDLCAVLFCFVGRAKELRDVVRRQDDGAVSKPDGVGI